MTARDRKRALARERAKRHRDRKREGRTALLVEIDDQIADWLYRARFLELHEVEDRDRLAAAVKRTLDLLARNA